MRKQLLLLGLFSLLLVSSTLGTYEYYQPYYGGGFGSFSLLFENFWSFIENNQYVVDAVVFLVVFLIVTKKVFSSFTEDKLLYVAVGIALTIGIMAYERRLGYSLILNSAWLSLLALVIFAAYMASTTHITGIRVAVISVLVLVALTIIIPQETPNFYSMLRNWLGVGYEVLMLVFGGALIYGIVSMLFPKIIGGKKGE